MTSAHSSVTARAVHPFKCKWKGGLQTEHPPRTFVVQGTVNGPHLLPVLCPHGTMLRYVAMGPHSAVRQCIEKPACLCYTVVLLLLVGFLASHCGRASSCCPTVVYSPHGTGS